jgi:hypothetical protein
MRVGLHSKGVAETRKALGELARKYPQETARALHAEGLGIQANAVLRAPVDTGRLRGSAYTTPPQVTVEGSRVEVGFNTDYAVFVHERTEVQHDPGEAKFLENAVNDRMDGFAMRMAQRVERQVKGTGGGEGG